MKIGSKVRIKDFTGVLSKYDIYVRRPFKNQIVTIISAPYYKLGVKGYAIKEDKTKYFWPEELLELIDYDNNAWL